MMRRAWRPASIPLLATGKRASPGATAQNERGRDGRLVTGDSIKVNPRTEEAVSYTVWMDPWTARIRRIRYRVAGSPSTHTTAAALTESALNRTVHEAVRIGLPEVRSRGCINSDADGARVSILCLTAFRAALARCRRHHYDTTQSGI